MIRESWTVVRAVGSFALVLALLSLPVSAATLLGSDQFGNLVSIDTNTGAGVLIGTEPNFPLSTEIEFDQASGRLWSDEVNGFTNLHELNPATGLSIGFVTHGCCALNGMEFVGATLYVTNNVGTGTSTLETINTGTGVLTPIGPTGFPPITGLAYDAAAGIMYGVTGGGGPAVLVTINLGNGIATPGPLLVDPATGAVLDHVGSIEFASDGVLYGGMGLNGNVNPGWLFSINITTGVVTFIGPTGLPGITGLTSPSIPVGACCPDGPGTESECIEVTEDECDLAGPQGGLFLGNGTRCVDVDDCVPLAVTMDSMMAQEVEGGVMIRWTTALELDTVGFRILRQSGNGREKALVGLPGFVPASGVGTVGSSYEYVDDSRGAGSADLYFIEDLDVFGKPTRHGPIPVNRGTCRRAGR